MRSPRPQNKGASRPEKGIAMPDPTWWNAEPGALFGDAPQERDYDEDDECGECGGEGWIDNDCFEDTCCCADPVASHGIRPCPLCNREAKY